MFDKTSGGEDITSRKNTDNSNAFTSESHTSEEYGGKDITRMKIVIPKVLQRKESDV